MCPDAVHSCDATGISVYVFVGTVSLSPLNLVVFMSLFINQDVTVLFIWVVSVYRVPHQVKVKVIFMKDIYFLMCT